MTIYLKQSTASQEVPLGPFLDDTDGKTQETALTIANTDVKLWISGATSLSSKNSGGATHMANGVYYAVLDATDTATLGPLVIFVHVAGALPIKVECLVLAANVFDSMIGGSDLLQVDATQVEGADATNTIRDSANAADVLQRLVTLLEPAGGSPNEFRFSVDALRNMPGLIWGAERASFTTAGSFGQYVPANVTYFGGTAGTFSGGRPEVNTTHAAGTAWNSGAIGAATLASDTITAAKIAADAIGASELAADAVAEIQSGLATAANLAVVAGYIDTEVAAIKAKTDNLPSDPADASDIATAFGTVNATLATIDARIDTEVPQIKQVTDKLHSMLEAATGSPGESRFTADALRNTPTSSGGSSAAAIAAAVWDEAISGHLTSGTTGAALNAAGSAGDPWATVLPGSYGAGTAGYLVGAIMTTSAEHFLTMVEVAAGSPGDYKFTPDALRAVIGVVPTAIENADALLNRDMSAVSDSNARSPLNALRFLRNKWSISGATLTVTKENDSTSAWTATVSTTAGADPVTGNDPA